ncbi:unnamed protein product [Oikopleura dioica]|uniref:LTD domain-containing protein n=1 Tax=Oikopleura dioica TaxID=34765 RepID=E4XWU3_OIKDI|nr:unnamed protein product [Oikopleura dioica]
MSALGLGLVGSPAARSQSEPIIDPAAITLRAGRLEFQFRAGAGSPADFELWRTTGLESPANWQAAGEATIEAVVEGIFVGSLPIAPEARAFVRVRRVGLPPVGPGPVLNEVMSDNVSAFAAEAGRFLDWIELFNPHDEAVELAGFGLSDDPANPAVWKFPSLALQPGARVVVFASDSPAGTPEIPGAWVANLGLRSGGDTLILSDPWGREIDRVVLPPLDPDQSIGRVPDGAARWHLFAKAQATPGWPNSPVSTGIVVAPPEFSVDGGFHDPPIELRLSTREPGGWVRYTLDGSVPNPFSPRYESPLAVVRTTVVRAVAYDPDGRPSEETARTFFIGVHHTLPVVSLAAPASHFEFRNGYLFGMGSRVLNARGEVLQTYPFSGSNAWQDREVEVHLEFHEPDGRPGFRQRAGLKVYGGWGSRGYPQKSLALFARRQYGSGRFEHAVFPDQEVDAFESLVLRNSGNDNHYFVNGTFTLLRDALMQGLLKGETDLDLQAYRPAVLYLNGEYWGLYNLREKFNEHHILAHHGLPPGAIDLIEGYGDIRAGDSKTYLAMRDFVNTRSLAVETNFQFVAGTYLAEDNFIDYHLAVIYFGNFDIGNIKCWRPRTPKGRFHWMVYDQDYGFDLWPAAIYVPAMARDYADYADMFAFATAGSGTSTGWPNAGGRTLLLRRLLANPGFRDRFVRRCADLLNSTFREERVESLVAGMAAVIRPEIAAHLHRWSWKELVARGYGAPYQPEFHPFTAATWETNLQGLVDFARSRPGDLRTDCQRHFALTGGLGELRVDVEPPGAGFVKLNTLELERLPWQGPDSRSANG